MNFNYGLNRVGFGGVATLSDSMYMVAAQGVKINSTIN